MRVDQFPCFPCIEPRKELEGHPHLQPPHAITTIVILIGAFVTISGLLSFCFSNTSAVVVALLALVIVGFALEPAERHYPSAPWLGVLCFMTLFYAVLIGAWNYQTNFVPAQAAQSGRHYHEVRPDEPASAFADMGTIEFTKDAQLDSTRALGLARYGRIFCVAPIISRNVSVSPQRSGPPVQFWAVGVDCCGERRSFSCDGSSEPSVHSGVVVADLDGFTFNAALAPRSLHDEYMIVVRAASVLYELPKVDSPVLLRWLEDPDSIISSWKWRSLLYWVLACCIHATMVTGVWFLIHQYFDQKVRGMVRASRETMNFRKVPSQRRDVFMLETDV